MKVLALLALAAVLVLPGGRAAAVTYDGANIPADFGGMLVSTQDNFTSFGDATGVNTGSELDQLYVARGQTGIYIAVSGNLETNGNACVILLDTAPGGSETLAATEGPGAITGLNGTILDAGFAPEYAVTVNTWGGTTYVNLTDLAANLDRYLGSSPVNMGFSLLASGDNPNNAEACFNNTNTSGVTDNAAKTPAENETDAATAASGLEMHLPFADLGIVEPEALTTIKVMVLLSGGGGWLSNQTLPGLGGGQPNLGQGGSHIDFGVFAGEQFAEVDVSAATSNYVILDGSGIPVDFAGHLVATQNNHTGFGDRSGEGGSELDQLFLGHDSGGLQLGITGNLETGGNFWLLFIDAGPGGSREMRVPDDAGPVSGVLQGLRGLVFNNGFAPTHVLCLNTWGGTSYVDLVDLKRGVSRYLGRSSVNGGAGDLVEGDNTNGAILAFNNTNTAGVTEFDSSSAHTATTGAEIYLPFADLGLGSCTAKVMVMLTSRDGFISNQTLAPLGYGMDNLGFAPLDLSEWWDLFVEAPLSGLTHAPVATVAEARGLADGSPVLLQNVRVSATFADEGKYYVQDVGSPAGLAVYDHSGVPAEGSLVSIQGFVTYAFGERAVGACVTTEVEPPGAVRARPIGMGCAAIGGGASGANPGVSDGYGPSNIGALVKTWGNVTAVDPAGEFFYVDDGSLLLDGTVNNDDTPHIGVRVLSDAAVTEGAFVAVVGVSTVLTTYGEAGFPSYKRLIRTRTGADVATIP